MAGKLTNFFIYVIIKEKGGLGDLYLNFNVLNNEVFETGCDEVAERAVVRNKALAAEGKQPCVGTIWAPDDFNG